MQLRRWLPATFVLWATLAGAQELPPVVAQESLGENACGPCAIVNSLMRAGPIYKPALKQLAGANPLDKARALLDKFAGLQSTAYGKGEFAYDPKRGMTWKDLTAAFNTVLADGGVGSSLEGLYLDRRANETDEAHLQRVHALLAASLRNGMPAVISVRSFVPEWVEEKKQFRWEGLRGHYVSITDVQPKIRDGEKGFQFTFADSYTGKLEFGYAWLDEARDFTAAKGDDKQWEWLTDRPFLLVTAPALRLRTQDQPWHLRTTIILNYAIVKTEPR